VAWHLGTCSIVAGVLKQWCKKEDVSRPGPQPTKPTTKAGDTTGTADNLHILQPLLDRGQGKYCMN
jgi:hypothetical protein